MGGNPDSDGCAFSDRGRDLYLAAMFGSAPFQIAQPHSVGARVARIETATVVFNHDSKCGAGL